MRTDHKRVKKIEMQCCSVTQTRLECLQLTRTIFLLFWVYTVHKTVIGLRRTTKIMYHTKFCRISKVCPGLLFYSNLFTTRNISVVPCRWSRVSCIYIIFNTFSELYSNSFLGCLLSVNFFLGVSLWTISIELCYYLLKHS